MTDAIARVPCPACVHRETMRARWRDREPCHDDLCIMSWVPPFRPRGAGGNPGMPSRWDRGSWECDSCGLRLTPEEAGILLDAALMHVDPDCDSIVDNHGNPIHKDALRALHGGRR